VTTLRLGTRRSTLALAQATLVADLRSAGLDLFTVSTDEDLVRALFRISQLRRRRRP
jgi:porphobilinogen deaminase